MNLMAGFRRPMADRIGGKFLRQEKRIAK